MGCCAVLFVLILILPTRNPWAVENGKFSWTAEMVAAYRAIAAKDSDEKTRNPDHLAVRFIHPDFKERFPLLDMDYDLAKRMLAESPAYFYVNARTHHMDDTLIKEAENGVTQVIVLGAGYDSRAYRFREAFPSVTFFEVDLPIMSSRKKQQVNEIFGSIPDHVVYIPLDFNTQSLEGALTAAGWRASEKSLFIWEGVTYFISARGVDGTLKCIAGRARPGSSVVFDYMLEPVIRGDYRYYGSRQIAGAVARRGEPYVFGIAEGAAEDFVRTRGLVPVSDLGPAELTRRYLIRSDGSVDGRMAEFLRIMHARVPEGTQQADGEVPAEKLEVLFADPAWDGEKVPKGQQCRRFGGQNPSTPPLLVKHVPEGTTAIVMEYSDKSYYPMDQGGHGKIGYRVPRGISALTIPPVPGHSFDLPEGFFLVTRHRGAAWDKAGAYMPPCSGGRGNLYTVTVKAVRNMRDDNKTFDVLDEVVLQMGRY
jgi:methyltransferase (TIGR00027 family)